MVGLVVAGGGDAAEEKQNKLRSLHQGFHILINISFSDPDPYWIRIQWPFGSVPGQELKKKTLKLLKKIQRSIRQLENTVVYGTYLKIAPFHIKLIYCSF